MTGVKVKITGFHMKDGKLVKRPVKLSRPAQYAKLKRQKWRPAK